MTSVWLCTNQGQIQQQGHALLKRIAAGYLKNAANCGYIKKVDRTVSSKHISERALNVRDVYFSKDVKCFEDGDLQRPCLSE